MTDENSPPILVLDEYLLTGSVSMDAVVDAIQKLRTSQWSRMFDRHTTYAELPDNEDDAFAVLLELRVRLAFPLDVSPSTMSKLSLICRLNRLIQSYGKGDMRPRQLERQISTVLRVEGQDGARSDDIEIMLDDLRYGLAMVGAPSEQGGIAEEEVADLCAATSRRLCAYWHALLG